MSFLTRGTSSSTCFILSSAFCSASCAARLESMPPGIWDVRISASTPVKSLSNWWYLRRTSRKCSAIGSNCRSSSPVS